MTPRRNRGVFAYALIALLLVVTIVVVMPMLSNSGKTVEYTEVITHFDDYEVNWYTLDLGTGELKYKLRGSDDTVKYTVPNVNIFLDDTDGYRLAYNKAHPDEQLEQDYFKVTDSSWILTVIPTILMLAMGGFVIFFMFRQSGGGKYSSFGKATVKPQSSQSKKATFADVAGAEEEKNELVEIVDFLKNPKKYAEIGARIPKGVLLLGPPGTGKTLLARAVAGEAGCPFFPISGSDFVEMFVGVGASRVRDLFEQAKKHAPAIIFIDEIDAVGRHRGAGLGGGHDEREQTLNQLLVEMDGFTETESVIVIAATNRSDILDPALLRPGRFDRQIVVSYPDVKGREEILRVHAKGKPLGPDVDLKVIAKTTQGFTGADLENLLNEAALLAARENRHSIIESDIEEATFKVYAGPEKKSHVITEHDKKITAYHEAGHAVATFHLETQEEVHQVSIIPRGMAAGITWSRPTTDDRHVSRKKMAEELVVFLGGRVAEALVLDDICTGASNDMERATKMARDMVTKYGFSERLGHVVYAPSSEDEIFLGRDYGHTSRNYGEAVASEIDDEVRGILDNAYTRCETILRENMDQLHRLANYLLEYEKIDGSDFERLMKGEDVRPAEDVKPKLDKTGIYDQANEPAPADNASEAEENPSAGQQDETK